VTGDTLQVNALLSLVSVAPPKDVYKYGSFLYYPAIFLLWAFKQSASNTESVLKQLFPNKVSLLLSQKALDTKRMTEAIQSLIFPLVKENFLPFMHNLAYLAGTLKSQSIEVGCHPFEIISSEEALQLILSNKDFENINHDKKAIALTIHQKLKPYADELRAQTQLLRPNEMVDNTQTKQPETIKQLMPFLNHKDSTFIPSENLSLSPNDHHETEEEKLRSIAGLRTKPCPKQRGEH